MIRRLTPVLAVLAAGVTAAGIGLTATLPAQAAAPSSRAGHHAAAQPRGATAKPLSRSQLADVRARQHRMLSTHRAAPAFDRAAAKTFTVNTTADSPLANPAGTTCVDTATAACSLRAAVEAANNLNVPVSIVLGKHTYTLSTGTALTVTNTRGVSVVGKGAGSTSIKGSGSNLFDLPAGSAPGALYLTSVKLTGGSASRGGAVQLEDYSGAVLALDHVTMSNNTASGYGGAIYAYDYASIYISHSTLTGNHAEYGGAIYQYWSDLRVHASSITGNKADVTTAGYGGAIYNEYGTFTMTGGSLSNNSAGVPDTYAGYGGAIYDATGLTTLTKVHVDGNTAEANGSAGAIYGYADTLTITGGTLSHNRANGVSYGSGGGIYSYYGASVTIKGTTMAGNRAGGNQAGYGGGALFAYGYGYPQQVVVNGATITGSNNAALYLYGDDGGVDASISGSTLSHNSGGYNGYSGYGCGGAVCSYGYEYGGMNLELQGNRLSGNTSPGYYGGGAVSVFSYAYTTGSVVMRHNTFSGNRTGAGGWGGAVSLISEDGYSPIAARSAANTFTGNVAGTQASAGSGGALSAYYTRVTDTGSTFSKNRAIGNGAYGGAVYDYGIYTGGSFTRTRFSGNSAGTNNSANSGYGGAAYTYNYGGDSFDQVTMAGNKSAAYGGGLYSDSYDVSFTRSTLSGNTAGSSATGGQGGGLFVSNAVLAVENSTLTGNKATSVTGSPGEGGAIFHEGSRLGLRYSTVTGNEAKLGAGVFSEKYATTVGSILSGNRASAHGAEKDCAVSSSAYVFRSLGGNVLGQASCVQQLRSGDKVTHSLHLGKLKDNGGPTKTMALTAKSPAVGRATYLIPSTDQRGHARPANHADAGAYELPKVKKHRH